TSTPDPPPRTPPLPLHDALPISMNTSTASGAASGTPAMCSTMKASTPSTNAMITVPRAYPENVYQLTPPATIHFSRILPGSWLRSEEHTSELQSRFDLVCRLLLE